MSTSHSFATGLVLASAIFFAGCTKTETTTETAPAMAEEMPAEAPMMAETPDSATFTLAEVSQHSTADDCWFVIDGEVYDVTEYIAAGTHPGGEAILNGCGTDATEMFGSIKDGQGHPAAAQAYKENFKIGTLAQ